MSPAHLMVHVRRHGLREHVKPILSSWRVGAGLLVETKQERIERLRLVRFKRGGGERGQDRRAINPVRRVQGREHELDEVVWDEESKTARAFRKVAGADTGWSVHEGWSGAANVNKHFPVKPGGLFRSKEEAMAAARCWAGGGSTTDECQGHGTGSKRGVGGANRGRPKKGVTTRVVELDGGESIEIPCGDHGRGAQWVDKGNSIVVVVARKKIGGKTVHKSFSMEKDKKDCWLRAKEWLEADE